MLQEREPGGTIEIDHAEQKVIVDHGGHCFLERAGTDERISAGSEEVPQATIHPRVCPDNEGERILRDVSFHRVSGSDRPQGREGPRQRPPARYEAPRPPGGVARCPAPAWPPRPRAAPVVGPPPRTDPRAAGYSRTSERFLR